MTSERIARDYLLQARGRRIALDALMSAGVHAAVVRESQEIVELILKGALRFVGIDPPKRHDIHDIVLRFIDRFPAEWRIAVAELREGLDGLARDRGPSFYGDEAEDIPPSELFGEAGRPACKGDRRPAPRALRKTVGRERAMTTVTRRRPRLSPRQRGTIL